MYDNLLNDVNESGLPSSVTPSDAEVLYKALSAGSSANPASMTGGNTLQFESLEPQLVSALAEKTEDFKLMKLQPKFKIGSTVHQYTQETSAGAIDEVFAAEGATPIETDPSFSRITRTVKYMQVKKDITLQTLRLNPAVGGSPEATLERLGTIQLLKAAEYGCFHGNASVSSAQFDGYPQQIRDGYSSNVFDMKGYKVSDATGKDYLDDAIRSIYEVGGEVSDMYFPPIIAKGFMDLLEDRMRYNSDSRVAGEKLTTYQTSYGNDIFISGRSGVDKMYRVKGVPTASTSASAPTAPTFTLTAATSTGGTGFVAATAGTYRYTVYAVDSVGRISAAATAANVAVASGQEVQVAITPGAATNTGYIVCRGKKDVTSGSDLREMIKVADSGSSTTTFLDQNDEYPGTAEILLLSSNMPESTYQWDSFMDLMRFDLGRVRASQPFLLVWYGTPDMKVAKYNGLIKNVGHTDIDWF